MFGLNLLIIFKHPALRKLVIIFALLGAISMMGYYIYDALDKARKSIETLTETKKRLEEANANQAKTITQQNARITQLNALQKKDHQQEVKDDARQTALQSENERLKATLQSILSAPQYQFSLPDNASELLKKSIDSLNAGTD